MPVRRAQQPERIDAPLIIIGAGAAGLCAALSAAETGVDAIILERDAVPAGSTSLSAGLIPAPGTRFQRQHGIVDDARSYAADIMRKNHHEADPALVEVLASEAGPTIEWLADRYGLPFSLVHDFDYPGHGTRRMHGLPTRSGAELIDHLREAAEAAGVTILTQARVSTLVTDAEGRVHSVEIERPDGTTETISCAAVILACNGYGGNPALVSRHVPEMAAATYFGHQGNQGDAVLWGEALGARLAHMSAYQGHGSVAHPHGILISWGAMTEGGFQVNLAGSRFSDENAGYSEQAAKVLAQPEGMAVSIFDERIAAILRQFADFRTAESSGAVLSAPDLEALAHLAKLPFQALRESFDEVERLKQQAGTDGLGRSFAGMKPLQPPFKAVRVTGALFHTQGGLAIDSEARVRHVSGAALPNLYAAGGAADGISGYTAAGYLSGNGLVTAVVLGRIAGRAAARQVSGSSS
ncbi:MAG: FAD-dependent oxidoreductase [Beijerinckiaceae bacterium]|nr:FAD-dependent oxidoreductase [Beijerinckiaceae bacterium]